MPLARWVTVRSQKAVSVAGMTMFSCPRECGRVPVLSPQRKRNDTASSLAAFIELLVSIFGFPTD